MEKEHYRTLRAIQDTHWFYRYRRALLSRVIAAHLPPTSGHPPRILDFGAGMGANLPVLAALGEVACVEREPIALEHLRSAWPGCDHSGATLDELVERGEWRGRFDVIVLSYVLYHRAIAEPGAALAKLRSFAAPGALLVNLEPAFRSLTRSMDRVDHGARRFSRRELLDAHREGGWSLVRTRFVLPTLFPAAWLIARLESGQGERPYEAPPEQRMAGSGGLVNRAMYLWTTTVDSWVAAAGSPFGVGILAVSRNPAGTALNPAPTRRSPGS